MNWSWDVGTLAGIRVRIHWTLLALIGLVGWSEWRGGGEPIAGMALFVGVFACILLHELGHALAARRYGIGTRSITLLPFGGLAALERIPSSPRKELVIALAGPAVNVVIAAVLWPIVYLSDGFGVTLLAINIMLVLFNLLPAFPMDGGRVLRAALATRMDHLRATRIAVIVGRVVAVGFVVASVLYSNPFLILIAVVVWTQGGAELRQLQRARSMSFPGEANRSAAPIALAPDDTLSRPIAIFARTGQADFPVLSGVQLVGVLRREQLSLAFARFGPEFPVGNVMERI
jgi:Zn-dependent protease